jgi:hypothetical protein
MNDNDIPILKKSYDLYKLFHEYRRVIPKCDRFTVFERSENLILQIIEILLEAGYSQHGNKATALETASTKVNLLRFLIRLMKETKSLDAKKYVTLQTVIDEIGRMLGGWLRSAGPAR